MPSLEAVPLRLMILHWRVTPQLGSHSCSARSWRMEYSGDGRMQ